MQKLLLLIALNGTTALAIESVDLSPAFCREKCSQSDVNGWCTYIGRNSTGAGPTVDPFDRLASLAHTPQVIFDNQCNQTITIEASSFYFQGSNCQISHIELAGNTITSKIPSATRGTIAFTSQGESELIFSGDLPTWDLGKALSPPLGENKIQFITEGKRKDGAPSVVWFDGYFCYSIERK